MTVQTKAREAADWFETSTRTDESSYVRTKEGAPEWVRELVYLAHGDMLPEDWRYGVIRDALDWIAESDDPEDTSGEFAESQVDIYTGNRLAWLASNLNRADYCDEADATWPNPAPSIIESIGQGQYMEASEVYYLVLQALQNEV